MVWGSIACSVRSCPCVKNQQRLPGGLPPAGPTSGPNSDVETIWSPLAPAGATGATAVSFCFEPNLQGLGGYSVQNSRAMVHYAYHDSTGLDVVSQIKITSPILVSEATYHLTSSSYFSDLTDYIALRTNERTNGNTAWRPSICQENYEASDLSKRPFSR